jgi:hypothetical protein
MGRALREHGVRLDDADIAAVAGNSARVAALSDLDTRRRQTAFQHIERVAQAGTLVDGTPSAPLAADLFKLAGTARLASNIRCYGRTTHSLFTTKRMGEFARIVGELAVKGRVQLANGDVVEWKPRTLRIPAGQHADILWGAVNHLAKNRVLPEETVLNAAREYDGAGQLAQNAQYAYRAEMANLMTRLTGKLHVNVEGSRALRHLNAIAEANGPLLAEYGRHGGSVARVEGNRPLSLDGGQVQPRSVESALGYVVLPLREARARSLSIIEYPVGDGSGYLVSREFIRQRMTAYPPERVV